MKKQFLILFAFISVLALSQVPQRFNKVIVTGDITSPKFIKTGSTADSVLLGNGSARAISTIKIDTVSLSNRINAKAAGNGTASGTNTGDETLSSIKTKLGAATSVSDGYLKYQDFNKGIVGSSIRGKKIGAIGDSFTEMDIYQPYLQTFSGINIISDGKGGSCITGGTMNAEGDGTLRVPIVSRVDKFLTSNTDLDYLIIEGGSNDWYYSANMGGVNSTDTLTYYGALDYIAKKCLVYNRNLNIIPITLTQRNTPKKSGGSSGRINYYDQKKYSDAMRDVFAKYGIAVLDAFNVSGITYENSSIYTTDGAHPNTAIGTERYSQMIMKFINSGNYANIHSTGNYYSDDNLANLQLNVKNINSGGLAVSGLSLSNSSNNVGNLYATSPNYTNSEPANSLNLQSFIGNLNLTYGSNATQLTVSEQGVKLKLTTSGNFDINQTGVGKIYGINFMSNDSTKFGIRSKSGSDSLIFMSSSKNSILGISSLSGDCNFGYNVKAFNFTSTDRENAFSAKHGGWINLYSQDDASRIRLNNSGSGTVDVYDQVNGNFANVRAGGFQTVSGTSSQYLMADGSVSTSAGVNQTQTTVNGSTSGTMVCSMPFRTGSYKKVIVRLNALVGSAEYTFPVSFSNMPIGSGNTANVSFNASSFTATNPTNSTSWYIIEGY